MLYLSTFISFLFIFILPDDTFPKIEKLFFDTKTQYHDFTNTCLRPKFETFCHPALLPSLVLSLGLYGTEPRSEKRKTAKQAQQLRQQTQLQTCAY